MNKKKMERLKKLQSSILFADPKRAGKITAKIAALTVDDLKKGN